MRLIPFFSIAASRPAICTGLQSKFRRWPLLHPRPCCILGVNPGFHMPEKRTIERAREDAREGKSPSSQAGEFVREEIHHIRKGKHGARSAKQAIAIGLSKARRAGVKMKPPKASRTSAETRRKAILDSARGKGRHKISRKRSRATEAALKREGKAAASTRALARQAHSSSARRSKTERVAAARKAARTRKSRSDK
jgi:hypothetical protein